MLSGGNTNVGVCVGNLIKTIRGEVPYERTKGMRYDIIDAPSTRLNEAMSDIDKQISIYEPRAEDVDVETFAENAMEGRFEFDVDME